MIWTLVFFKKLTLIYAKILQISGTTTHTQKLEKYHHPSASRSPKRLVTSERGHFCIPPLTRTGVGTST